MANVNLVLFDLAGTIIQPDPPVEIQYESTAQKMLPPEHIPPRRTIRERFRVAFQSIGAGTCELRYGTTQTEGLFFWKRVLGAVFPTIGPRKLQKLTEELYRQFNHPRSWAILSGAEPILHRLSRRSMNVALLSNWDRRGRKLVEKLGLDEYVSRTYISSEEGLEKPDPRFFMRPVKDFDTSPDRALMVGNEPELDLVPAESIGMDTLLLIGGSSMSTGHLWPNVAHSWLDVANRLTDVEVSS